MLKGHEALHVEFPVCFVCFQSASKLTVKTAQFLHSREYYLPGTSIMCLERGIQLKAALTLVAKWSI